MKYYETMFNAVIKQEIDIHNSYEILSNGINYCLKLNERTRDLHQRTGVKGYCFLVKEKFPLKTGQLVHMILRCYDKQMMDDFIEALLMCDNESFMCQNIIYSKEYEFSKLIKRYVLKTQTPVILKGIDMEFKDTEEIIRRLGNNIAKKYRIFYDENVDQSFNPVADFKNITTYYVYGNYKGAVIKGRQILIKFKTDELSQKMAFCAMACGVGEKNSLGFGYCKSDNDYLYEF